MVEDSSRDRLLGRGSTPDIRISLGRAVYGRQREMACVKVTVGVPTDVIDQAERKR